MPFSTILDSTAVGSGTGIVPVAETNSFTDSIGARPRGVTDMRMSRIYR